MNTRRTADHEPTCTTAAPHCELCGDTDVDRFASYSDCCNELIVRANDCRGHHITGPSISPARQPRW